MTRRVKGLTLVLALIGGAVSGAQPRQAYFADGYHGGVYGHYPEWKTRFIIDKMKENPLWKINLEIEPETWDSVKVREPEAYAEFRRLVNDPRVEFTNPTYAQPYLFNVSGESMIRQFGYGIRKIHEHFPDVKFTTYSAEEPCFTSSLPRVLKLFGFRYAVLKNPDTCWGGYMAGYGGELVNWVGPDGTRMLTVPRYACEELEDNSTWQTKAWNNNSSYLKACFDYGIENPVGMCFQDAGWKNGPWLGEDDGSANRYVTWTDYIENISVASSDDDWRVSQEDVRVALMWGSQVMQRIGRRVRHSENRIVVAEKINSMASIAAGAGFMQDQFDKGWRTLMLAQHHDSWIVPYNGLFRNGTWAQNIEGWTAETDDVSDRAILVASQALDSKRGLDGGVSVRVFNPVGSDRTEPVRVELGRLFGAAEFVVYGPDGQEVPSAQYVGAEGQVMVFRAKVPSFGYATYRLKKEKRNVLGGYTGVTFADNGDCILENDMYHIVLDASRGGVIRSLVAKKENGKEFVDMTNEFRMGEIRGYFYSEGEFFSSADNPVRISVVEDTPLTTSVRIEGKINSHPFSQIISIASGRRGIDFDMKIDWQGNPGIGEYRERDWRGYRRAYYDTRYMLSVMFPNSLGEGKIYKDAPFDVCESRLNDTFFNTWDSIKNNIILHWVDLVQKGGAYGLALFSDHTTSYSHGSGFPLALTAQYSGGGLWGRSYDIDGPTQMKYTLVPHKGRWDKAGIANEAALRNGPLEVVVAPSAEAARRSLIGFDRPGYEITAVTVDGKDVYVRLFNAEGDEGEYTIDLGFPVAGIDNVNLMGQIISPRSFRQTVDGAAVSVSMPRFGIETFRIRMK